MKIEFTKNTDEQKEKELKIIEKLRKQWEDLIIETKAEQQKYKKALYELNKEKKRVEKLRQHYEDIIADIEALKKM